MKGKVRAIAHLSPLLFPPLMPRPDDLYSLPPDLPVPEDDGACNHLWGMAVPAISLQATTETIVTPSTLPGHTVIYIYPRTGTPDHAAPDGWDLIPGARGCTPQSCSFRNHFQELKDLDATVYGLSTQDTAYQQEAVERLHLPFPLLSDAALAFALALRLPTFNVQGLTLLKRVTLILKQGHIEYLFYPVFPPDKNAEQVLAWLQDNPS